MELLPKETFELMKDKTSTEILAVYLTGSHLNNLNNENSDVDYFIIRKPTFEEVVSGNYSGGELSDGMDAKVYNLFHFVNLMKKSNPNLLEVLFKYPLYTSDSYKPLADQLYNNRDSIIKMNVDHLIASCLGMMIQNIKRLKEGSSKNGKVLVNFYKAFYQIDALAGNRSLEDVVVFKDEIKNVLMAYKETDYQGEFLKNEIEVARSILELATIVKNDEHYKEEYTEGVTDLKPLVWIDLLSATRKVYKNILEGY